MKTIIIAIALSLLATTQAFAKGSEPGVTGLSLSEKASTGRFRVIIDNDLSGDPDGLFQLAHQVLSPSTDVVGVIGSFHYQNFYHMKGDAASGADEARQLLTLMGKQEVKVMTGGEQKLTSTDAVPEATEASDFIISEAMKKDKRPLFVLCGVGLTNIATAYLRKPEIAKHLTLVWIGGPEYKELCKVNPRPQTEYNLGIDIIAAQVIFNKSDIPLWQIPRNAYRQCIYSMAELNEHVRTVNQVGKYLMEKVDDMMQRAGGVKMGETYVLGDSPLTLVTALQTAWEADPASCEYQEIPCPVINDKGWYSLDSTGLTTKDSSARKIRVFTYLDKRLMIEDFYAKIKTL